MVKYHSVINTIYGRGTIVYIYTSGNFDVKLDNGGIVSMYNDSNFTIEKISLIDRLISIYYSKWDWDFIILLIMETFVFISFGYIIYIHIAEHGWR